MSPEACNLMRGNRLIEDALFGPNAPDTWPPGDGKNSVDLDTSRHALPAHNQFANTEPSHISTPGAVAKCDEASEGPERDGHKPLMRNRTSDVLTPIGSTAPGHLFCTCAGFRIASDCPKHAR
jgi:hypothetical protein